MPIESRSIFFALIKGPRRILPPGTTVSLLEEIRPASETFIFHNTRRTLTVNTPDSIQILNMEALDSAYRETERQNLRTESINALKIAAKRKLLGITVAKTVYTWKPDKPIEGTNYLVPSPREENSKFNEGSIVM